jgi:hypothetical protein
MAVGAFLCLPLLIWLIVRIVAGVSFSIDCSGHIKRAADANTIELAKQELVTVIKYCDDHALTSGVVSIFLKQPKNDVGFWYQNLSSSLNELNKLDTNSSQLEKTNVLMKLRETLTDQGETLSITAPKGITIYPHNISFFLWAMFGTVLAVVGGVFFIKGLEDF